MTLQLPDGANLEFARKQAKQLQRQLRDAEPSALSLAREFHPRAADADAASHSWLLSDAQLILARQFGEDSWTKLRQAIEQLRPLAEQARAFVDSMFGWQDGRFMDILASNPAVAGHDFICRLLCGAHEELATLLAEDPDAARRKFAPLDRELILYVSYSKMHVFDWDKRKDLLRCMELLLAAGADPNAAYDEGGTWAGALQTCLYGATGHGNFPAMAKLLLEAGADPNDDECMWHCPQFMYTQCLELLLQYGGNPSRRSEKWTNTPLYFLLGHRTNDKGYETAMRGVNWLLEHGADPNIPCYDWEENCLQLAIRLHQRPDVIDNLLRHKADGSYKRRDGANAYTLAMRSGNDEAMRLLQEHGVEQEFGQPGDVYMMLVMTASRADADAWLEHDPDAVKNLGVDAADAFCDAAERGRSDVVRIMLEHGWDPAMADEWGRQPLHCAALRGFAYVVRLLLAAGAPLDRHDKLYNGTPIGWALHGALQMPAEEGDYLSVVEQIVAAGGLEFANDQDLAERDIARVREKYGE